MSNLLEGRETGAVLGGAVLYCAGALIFSVMPAYLGNIDRLLHVSPAALGDLSAAELWSIAIASLTGPAWIKRFKWRMLARIGAVTALVGQLTSLWVTHFDVLLIVRVVTGIFGEGLLMALSYSLLAQTRNVERSFGLAYAASTVVGTVCLYSSPQLDRALGGISVLAVLAVLAVVALCISGVVPDNSGGAAAAESRSPSSRGETGWRSRGALALIGQAIWYAGAGGFWSFTEQLGADNALSVGQIARAMGIGTAAALLGTLLAAGMSNRFGRAVPIMVSTVAMGIAVFAFVSSGVFGAVAAELALFNIFWACGTIYVTATACSLDRSGKIAVLLPAFQTLGMALGTFVLGRCIKGLGFGSTPWIVAGFLGVGLLLVLLCLLARKSDLTEDAARKTLQSIQ